MTAAALERANAETKLPPKVRNALLALIVGGIVAILDSTMVTLALHTLVNTLHSSDGTIQWVTTGYLMAMAVAIPTTGWAESRWGGKRVWMAALVLFVLGSVLCALAWSDISLIGFRVLQGFAAGLIFPLMQTLGVKAAGGHASPKLIATVSLPLALGPVIGGVILNWLSWRWLFLAGGRARRRERDDQEGDREAYEDTHHKHGDEWKTLLVRVAGSPNTGCDRQQNDRRQDQ
jgi:predicted MFS family arabinose efflux permease